VILIAYDSASKASDKAFVIGEGRVQRTIKTVGHERAYCTYNSVQGNCGAPALNPQGKVVGFHNANAGTENVFIPITKDLAHSATGSVSSF